MLVGAEKLKMDKYINKKLKKVTRGKQRARELVRKRDTEI
jgi:hypothetical protein